MPEMPLGKFSSNNITLTFILQVEIDFDLLDGSQLNALVINAVSMRLPTKRETGATEWKAC